MNQAVDSADAQPTEGEMGVFAMLDKQLEEELAKWREITATDVATVNSALRNANIPAITLK